jgi:hypothetical protein
VRKHKTEPTRGARRHLYVAICRVAETEKNRFAAEVTHVIFGCNPSSRLSFYSNMDIVSLRKGDLGNFQRQLRVISKRKEDLLREQAEVAKVLNATYTDWVDDSKTVCKSLETCVVLSRRPGTLPYVYGKKQNVEDTEKLIERIRNIQEQVPCNHRLWSNILSKLNVIYDLSSQRTDLGC